MCALLQPRTSTTHPTALLCAWFLQDNNCTDLEEPLFLHWPLQNHNPPKNEYLNLNLKRLSHQNLNIQYVCHASCWDTVSMKMFVHVVSLLQCDKNISILLAATQKKKQTILQSLPGRTLAGLSQSLTKPSLKFEITNLLFLHPMATLFYSDNCRDSSSTKGVAAGTPASVTQNLHVQGAQSTGLTTETLTFYILLHIQVVIHTTSLQLPPVSHLSGLRKRIAITHRYLWTQVDIHSSQETQCLHGTNKFTSIPQTNNKTKASATVNWKMMLTATSTAASSCWGSEQPEKSS